MEFAERGGETLRRLHRLVRRGYVADLGRGDVEDAIFLDHLGDGPSLILYGDGKLVAMNESHALDPRASEDQHAISNVDEQDARTFDRFLATVREPTWRQRTRPDREKYVWQPGCMVVMLAALYGAGALAVWILRALTGWPPP